MKKYFKEAYYGALVADALSMPVHWYYNRDKLDKDYPNLTDYNSPNPFHPDSILWRSSYTPVNNLGNILHDHSKYWGKKNIHYHQFLNAGENTLNLRLAINCYEFVVNSGSIHLKKWLNNYTKLIYSHLEQRYLLKNIIEVFYKRFKS